MARALSGSRAKRGYGKAYALQMRGAEAIVQRCLALDLRTLVLVVDLHGRLGSEDDCQPLRARVRIHSVGNISLRAPPDAASRRYSAGRRFVGTPIEHGDLHGIVGSRRIASIFSPRDSE